MLQLCLSWSPGARGASNPSLFLASFSVENYHPLAGSIIDWMAWTTKLHCKIKLYSLHYAPLYVL